MTDNLTSYADSEWGKCTDIGNALRLADRFHLDLRYVPTHGWMRYEGHRMVQLAASPMDEGTALPELILTEAREQMDPGRVQELAKWAVKSSSEGRIRAALNIMSDMPSIRATHEMMDRNPTDLNTPIGVFDLNTGSVHTTAASNMLTRSTRVFPKPGAPVFDNFLKRVLPSQDVRNYLQRAVGYSLTAMTREEVFFILYGSGQNGKSKLLSALNYALDSYAHSFDPKLIMQQKYEGHPTNIASLHGVRFAYSSEVDHGAVLDEGRVKALTGGDEITARFMRKDEFTWRPSHKLWIATNHLPVIKGTDKGMWRRIVVIPFDVAISDDERDNMLEEKLFAEAAGILAWAIDGASEYLRYGLNPPVEVQMASDHYKQEQDSTSMFLNECTYPDPNAVCPAGDLYLKYKRWAEDNGVPPLSSNAFGRELSRLQYEPVLIQNKRARRGLRLLEGSLI